MANGVRITPNINTQGIFEVEAPYRINPKRVYEVLAIREFPDLWADNIDVYEAYYEPVGLDERTYDRDKKLGAAIITLSSEDGVIYIPDTFIISYPDLGLANYAHTVISLSLGPILKTTNLNGLIKELEGMCSRFLGVNAKGKRHVAPVRDAITADEAKQLEKVRQGMKNVPITAELNHLNQLRQNQAIVQQINNALLTKFKS